MAKKKVKKANPKVSKDININIKNIMKQIQNEPPRQKQDFIRVMKKRPIEDFNTGQMSRAFAPAVTYASNPLQAFQGVAPIANPPAIAQISAAPPRYKSQPVETESNPFDIAPRVQPPPLQPVTRAPLFLGDVPAPAWSNVDELDALDLDVDPAKQPAKAYKEALSEHLPDYRLNLSMNPQIVPASSSAAQAAAPRAMPVFRPINQPYTSRANILEMMGASESDRRMDRAADRISMLSKQYPMTSEAGRIQQKQERLIAEGKIVLSASGRPMFPRQPGQ